MRYPTRVGLIGLCWIAATLLLSPLCAPLLRAQPKDGYDYAGALGEVKAALARECVRTEQQWDGTASFTIQFLAGPLVRDDQVFVAYVVRMNKTLNAQSGQPGRVIDQDVFTRGSAESPVPWGSLGELRAKFPAYAGRAQPPAARLEQGLARQQARVLAAHAALKAQAADLQKMADFYARERADLMKKWGDLILEEQRDAHVPSSLKGDGFGLTKKELQNLERENLGRVIAEFEAQRAASTARLERTLEKGLADYLVLKKALIAARKPDAQQTDQDAQDIAVGRTLLDALDAPPAQP